MDTFCFINNGEIWVKGMNITPYFYGSYNTVTNDGGGAICIKSMNDVANQYVSGTIQNAYFAHNEAYRGGAIEFDGVDAGNNVKFILRNNTMEHNEAKLGGALLINEGRN